MIAAVSDLLAKVEATCLVDALRSLIALSWLGKR
jgi:hypothetical protein